MVRKGDVCTSCRGGEGRGGEGEGEGRERGREGSGRSIEGMLLQGVS